MLKLDYVIKHAMELNQLLDEFEDKATWLINDFALECYQIVFGIKVKKNMRWAYNWYVLYVSKHIEICQIPLLIELIKDKILKALTPKRISDTVSLG